LQVVARLAGIAPRISLPLRQPSQKASKRTALKPTPAKPGFFIAFYSARITGKKNPTAPEGSGKKQAHPV